MAKLIADILGTDRVTLNHLIETWENKSGNESHDVRLYADMRSRSLRAVQQLGLDPSDTVAGELYFALQERAKADSIWLANYLGITNKDDPNQLIQKVIDWVEKNSKTNIWVCKPTLVRGYLKKLPPKSLMKALSLRSIDSMLKRNNPAEILTLARELESAEWVKKFELQFKKCTSSDFSETKIEFIIVEQERIVKLRHAGFPSARIATANYELGSIVLLPPAYRFPLDVLAITLTIGEILGDLRRVSSYYRALSVKSSFGDYIYNTVSKGLHDASRGISEIGWNSLHRHLVGNEYFISRLEQPYLTKEDIKSVSALELLAGHDERFNYWKDLDYVFFQHPQNTLVSMNLIDVVTNATNRSPLHAAGASYGRMRLWEELWARYLRQDHIAEEVIDQFITS